MKHTKGSAKLTFSAGIPATVFKSITAPCNGGIKAPPTIAMTRKAAPRVVSRDSTFSRAIPYIVGNMSDINALMPIKQYNPVMSVKNIVPIVQMEAQIPNTNSNLREFT